MNRIRIKYNRRPFLAARDDNGVPHIVADSWHSVLYGLGYMHAMDRTTQILFARAVASGRSCELIANKPELFETDCFFRRVGLHLRLDDEVDALSDAERGDFEAYCQGVTDGMKQAGRSLPMWATRFQIEPWDAQSSMLLGKLLAFNGLAVGQLRQEQLLLELIQAGVRDDRMRELFSPLLNDADFDLLRKVKMARRLSDEALELMADLPYMAGSNAWAVSPKRSATGGALLASDPHLEVNRLPAIWYEAVLRWNNRYAMGATLPGCPIMGVGRTNDLAWGVTYLKGDTSDYFIEECREVDGRWQYRRGDSWHDFKVREEPIIIKGEDAYRLQAFDNDIGTLDCDPDQLGEGLHLNMAIMGLHTGAARSLATWSKLLNIRTAAEAMDLVRECPQPTLCWTFADRDGHIGMQAAGWVPRRPAHIHGLLPIPAWDPANHWRGRLPADVFPRVYDPPEGFISTANEALNPPEGPLLVTLPVPDYRKRRIDERLAELPQATLQDMQELQYDVISLQARDLLNVFLPHLPEGEVKRRLSQWDCNYSPESEEATLFNNLYRRVLLEVFGQEPEKEGGIGWRRMVYLCSRAGFSIMVVTRVDKLLQQEESVWLHGRDKGELIRRAATILENEPTPPWGQTNAFSFTNRFFEAQRVGWALGFHSGDLPMRGCFATPFQGHLLRVARRESTFAPSYHFTTDMSTDESFTNLPGGPSESRFSRWYKSDIPRWMNGEYKRLCGLFDL